MEKANHFDAQARCSSHVLKNTSIGIKVVKQIIEQI